MAKIGTIVGVILVVWGVLGFFSNPIAGANGVFVSNTWAAILQIVLGALMLWNDMKKRSGAVSQPMM